MTNEIILLVVLGSGFLIYHISMFKSMLGKDGYRPIFLDFIGLLLPNLLTYAITIFCLPVFLLFPIYKLITNNKH